MFVAGGNSSSAFVADPTVPSNIMTSPDGVSWTLRTTPFDMLLAAPALTALGAYGGHLVAGEVFPQSVARLPVQEATRLGRSTDGGVTFTPVASPFDFTWGHLVVEIKAVVTDGLGTWLAGGAAYDPRPGGMTSISLAVSTDDGATWTQNSTPADGVRGYVDIVHMVAGVWLIGLWDGFGRQTLISGDGGVTWAVLWDGSAAIGTDWIATDGTLWVVDGFYSTDGRATWTAYVPGDFHDMGGVALNVTPYSGAGRPIMHGGALYAGGAWVCVATVQQSVGPYFTDVFTSPDGRTWTATGSGPTGTDTLLLWDVTSGGTIIGRLVTILADSIVTSTDGGHTWSVQGDWPITPLTLDHSTDDLYTSWSTSTPLVAPGSTTGIAYSADLGTSWTHHAALAAHYRWSASSARVSAVAWNGSYFLAVGTDGTGYSTVMSSPDGVTWTLVASPLDAQVVRAAAVHWNGSLWMVGHAIGNLSVALHPNVMTSPDGTTWTTHDVTFLDGVVSIGWVGGVWEVSDGSTQFAYSSDDGATWTAIASQRAHAFLKTP